MSTVLKALRKADEDARRGGKAGLGNGLPPEPPGGRGPRPLLVVLGGVALLLAFLVGLEFSGSDSVPVAEDQPPAEWTIADAPEGGGAGVVAIREERTNPSDRMAAARPAAPSAPNAEPAAGGVPSTESARQAEPRPPTAVAPPAKVESPAVAPPSEGPAAGGPGDVRERRQARRDAREESRRVSREMREAVQNAQSDEEREALIAKFREQRAVARAEQRAADAERRLRFVEEAKSERSQPTPEFDPQIYAAAPPEGRPGGPATSGGRPGGPATSGVRPEPLGVSPVRPTPAADVPDPARKVLRRAPSGAPAVRINILQYSRDPDRRFAYVSLEGQPAMTQVREGESYQGLTVKRIFPDVVEFDHSGSLFLMRAN